MAVLRSDIVDAQELESSNEFYDKVTLALVPNLAGKNLFNIATQANIPVDDPMNAANEIELVAGGCRPTSASGGGNPSVPDQRGLKGSFTVPTLDNIDTVFITEVTINGSAGGHVGMHFYREGGDTFRVFRQYYSAGIRSDLYTRYTTAATHQTGINLGKIIVLSRMNTVTGTFQIYVDGVLESEVTGSPQPYSANPYTFEIGVGASVDEFHTGIALQSAAGFTQEQIESLATDPYQLFSTGGQSPPADLILLDSEISLTCSNASTNLSAAVLPESSSIGYIGSTIEAGLTYTLSIDDSIIGLSGSTTQTKLSALLSADNSALNISGSELQTRLSAALSFDSSVFPIVGSTLAVGGGGDLLLNDSIISYSGSSVSVKLSATLTPDNSIIPLVGSDLELPPPVGELILQDSVISFNGSEVAAKLSANVTFSNTYLPLSGSELSIPSGNYTEINQIHSSVVHLNVLSVRIISSSNDFKTRIL